jgi:bacteriocin-like protein
MNHELNINELDAVSGGLKNIPDEDRFNQAMSNGNKGTGFGGSLTGALVGPTTGGCAATGGHPFDYPSL